MIGTTYVDTQDNERHLRPIKDLGNEYECEVFWYSANGRSNPGGRVRLSKKLFHPDTTIGFRPWVPEPPKEAPEEEGDDA